MFRIVIRNLIDYFKLVRFKNKWRKNNSHNNTVANTIFPLEKVIVGYKTYGKLNVSYYGNPREKLVIGRYCCIANDVKFILGGEHHPDYITNYLFKYYLEPNNDIDDRRTKGPIIIEDDVWIGVNSVILSGVRIGKGAVIAAGSIVTKDVPPYAIYTTNRIIRYRFDDDIIRKLMKLDFGNIDYEFVKNNMNLFYSSNIEDSLMQLNEGLKQ